MEESSHAPPSLKESYARMASQTSILSTMHREASQRLLWREYFAAICAYMIMIAGYSCTVYGYVTFSQETQAASLGIWSIVMLLLPFLFVFLQPGVARTKLNNATWCYEALHGQCELACEKVEEYRRAKREMEQSFGQMGQRMMVAEKERLIELFEKEQEQKILKSRLIEKFNVLYRLFDLVFSEYKVKNVPKDIRTRYLRLIESRTQNIEYLNQSSIPARSHLGSQPSTTTNDVVLDMPSAEGHENRETQLQRKYGNIWIQRAFGGPVGVTNSTAQPPRVTSVDRVDALLRQWIMPPCRSSSASNTNTVAIPSVASQYLDNESTPDEDDLFSKSHYTFSITLDHRNYSEDESDDSGGDDDDDSECDENDDSYEPSTNDSSMEEEVAHPVQVSTDRQSSESHQSSANTATTSTSGEETMPTFQEYLRELEERDAIAQHQPAHDGKKKKNLEILCTLTDPAEYCETDRFSVAKTRTPRARRFK